MRAIVLGGEGDMGRVAVRTAARLDLRGDRKTTLEMLDRDAAARAAAVSGRCACAMAASPPVIALLRAPHEELIGPEAFFDALAPHCDPPPKGATDLESVRVGATSGT